MQRAQAAAHPDTRKRSAASKSSACTSPAWPRSTASGRGTLGAIQPAVRAARGDSGGGAVGWAGLFSRRRVAIDQLWRSVIDAASDRRAGAARAPDGTRSRRRGVAAATHEGSAGLPPGCTQPAAVPGTLATMGNSDGQQELAGSDEEVELSEVRPWIACSPAPAVCPVSGQRARHRPAAQPCRPSPARAGGALRGAGQQRRGGQRR